MTCRESGINTTAESMGVTLHPPGALSLARLLLLYAHLLQPRAGAPLARPAAEAPCSH